MDPKWSFFMGDEVFKFNAETGEAWVIERDDDDDEKSVWVKIGEKKEEK